MLIVQPNHSPSSREHTLFADSSGQKHNEVMFMAGFAASEQQWLRFEVEWKALMAEWHINEPFHTVAYVAGRGADYRQFNKRDDLRAKFEAEAIRVIKDNTRKPISIGLNPSDLIAATAPYVVPDALATPLNYCGFNLVVSALEWMKKHTSGHDRVEQLRFIFEDGDDDKEGFARAIEKITGERPLFEPKDRYVQFAAADILAWRHSRYQKQGGAPQLGKYECFKGLFKHIPHDDCHVLDSIQISDAIAELDFPEKA